MFFDFTDVIYYILYIQPGMTSLESYLRDTEHTLKIIEDFNETIDEGQVSLDGVAIVSLDVESMYSNMSEELATGAVTEYLESPAYLQDGNSKFHSQGSGSVPEE